MSNAERKQSTHKISEDLPITTVELRSNEQDESQRYVLEEIVERSTVEREHVVALSVAVGGFLLFG